jgi:signal transduction histidine kinase
MKLGRFVPAGITPQNMLAAPVFFVMLSWVLLANLSESATRDSVNIAGRLELTLLVHLAHWGLLLLIAWVAKIQRRELEGLPFIAVLLSVAFLRGLALHLGFEALGVAPLPELWVRITFSVLYVGVGMIVVGLWLHQIRLHNELLESMFAEQARLSLVRQEAESKIFEANQNLIAEIKDDLLRRVDRLDQTKPLESLSELRDAIDHVVRPMSEQLAYKSQPWEPEPIERNRKNVSWRRVFIESFYVSKMHPVLVPLLVLFLLAPSVISYVSLSNAWLGLIGVSGSQALMLFAYQAVARQLFNNSSRITQTFVVIFGYLSIGVASTILASFLIALNIPGRPLPLQTLIYGVLIGLIVSLVTQSLRAMKRVELDLAATTVEASWEITRIRQLHRELEQGLANKLHGKIQGTLAASYLKLSRSVMDGQTSAPLDEYKQALVRSILDLDNETQRPSRLDSVLEETSVTWADVCNVTWNISAETKLIIGQDDLLGHALEDVIPELAFNSVKHGRAKSLTFTFEIVDDRTLSMIASDDGRQTGSSGRVGLGSKLLDDCCISWQRDSTPAGTVTRCDLPLKAEKG